MLNEFLKINEQRKVNNEQFCSELKQASFFTRPKQKALCAETHKTFLLKLKLESTS